MSNLKDLKLKDVEVLSDVDSMSAALYSSSSGYSGSGGSGSGIYTPCYDDECQSNSDCGTGRVCYKHDCGLMNSWSYKKCRNMDDNEKSCSGKRLGQECQLYNDRSSTKGYCSQTAWSLALFCYRTPIS